MSFILDALKKAESERNRHIAPVLLDARIAPPRRGLPAWAWGLGAVLLANLGLLLWILTRTPEAPRSAESAAQATAQPSTGSQIAATPAAASIPSPASTPSPAPAPAASPQAATLPPAIAPIVPVPVAIPSAVPAPAGVPAVSASPVSAPVTVAPMPAPVSAAPPAISAGPSLSTSDERLPGMHELRAAGVRLPELVLNLHIYDPSPANRSILLNGQRLREGEYTPDGVRLERITPDAVILEASGRRFRLGTAD